MDDYTQILKERAARYAQIDQNETQKRRVLELDLGGARALIPKHAARAILPLTSITPLPFSPPHLAGLTPRLGRAIPVFHLRVILGLPLRGLPETSRVVVLDAPGYPALAIDGIYAQDEPDIVDLREPLSTLSPAVRPFVRGVYTDGRILIDIDALLESPILRVDIGPRRAPGEGTAE